MLTTLALLASPAHAFCGAFVADADTELVNQTSQVILAREDQRTTLTLINDYEGPLNQFAMVIPVPEVLDEDDVRVLSPTVLEEVERYSGPRLVRYTCDDFHDHYEPRALGCSKDDTWDTGSWADTGSAALDSGTYATVDVEAEFTVGDYELVVLSAEESSGLVGWLNTHGYTLDPATEDMLQDYIDSGSYFLAAKVDLAENFGTTTLDPLQIAYTSEAFSLPIRLGTVNSPGVQDVVIYALTDSGDGRLGIANYEERQIDWNECMLAADDTLDDRYAAEVSAALDGHDEAGWVFEYGWNSYHCDPCPEGEALPDDLIRELGHSNGSWGTYFSRIRMRYTPEQATEDLVLYTSNITDRTQFRFIEHNDSFEDRFEVCGVGWTENPGDCESEFRQLSREERREEGVVEGGCTALEPSNSGIALLTMLAGLVGLRRRAH